jgi:hypothetical protein
MQQGRSYPFVYALGSEKCKMGVSSFGGYSLSRLKGLCQQSTFHSVLFLTLN